MMYQGPGRRLSALPEELPPPAVFAPGIRRAPDRGYTLTPDQTVLALKNALRYGPPVLYETIAPEFLAELRGHGRIYGYRFRPVPAADPASRICGVEAMSPRPTLTATSRHARLVSTEAS